MLLAGPNPSVATAAITFDGSPATSAPPPTLGSYTMTPFPDDPSANDTDVVDVPGPTGSVLFSHAMRHSSIGDGWGSWSHGYVGDVYTTVFQPQPDSDSVTMSLPADTGAFYFYAEPSNFGVFTIEARAQDGTTSGPIPVEGGVSGARYFGFYATGADVLVSITVDAASSGSGFAVGELGIASLLPAPPTLTDTDPDSPANDNTPRIKGTAAAGSTVRLFTNDDCSSVPIATGSAEEFASPGLQAFVPDDSSTTFRATTTDGAGNSSSCSSSSITYTEDSSPPAEPTVTDTDPDSPANDGFPEVKGSAEPGSTVRVYEAPTSSDCTPANLVATGTAAEFASPGLEVSVPDNSSTTFRGSATDTAGNSSGCSSSSIVYVELHAECDLVASKTDGADPPVGDGINTAFRTAQQLADALRPGQTGCIRGYPRGSVPDASSGLYSENVTIGNGGTSNLNRITLRSAPGEVAQLKGRLRVTGNFVTVSHLVLDGRNTSNLASPTVNGNGVVFSDNNVTSRNTVSCFQVDLDARLLRNRIRNCRIGVLVGGSSVTIQENLIYDNSSEGISFEPDSQSATVHKNILDGNGMGIRFEGDPFQAADQSQVRNSIVSFSTGGYNVRTTFDAQKTGSNALIDNCLWTSSATYSGSPAKSGIDPNAYSQGLTVSGTTIRDPGYTSRSAKNFHITSRSPCYAKTGDIAQVVDGGGGPTDSDAMNLRPNILFIVTDDQRLAGTMAYMPQTMKWLKNGNAASGIAGGTEFGNAFVTTPLCCPSRTSILTGQYAHNHGAVLENITGTAFSQLSDNTLDDAYPMLQRYLDDTDAAKGLDYQTAIFGKYLNGWDPCAASPAPIQPPHFDRYAIFQTGSYINFKANDQGTGYGCGSDPPRVQEYSNSWLSSKARSFIDETESNDSVPWFMYVAPAAPHASAGFGGETPPVPEPNKYDIATFPRASLGSPESNAALCESRTQLNDNPQWVRSQAGLVPTWMETQAFKDQYPAPTVSCNTTAAATDPAREREVQLRTLKSIDDLDENIFQKLNATGEEKDTLAFFISDNGWMWGEHGLRGKNKPYTDSIQVPLFMRWPGNSAVKQGFRDLRLAANIDLAPTVLDALGITPDAGSPPDGKSLLRASTRSEILAEAWRTESGVNVPFWASIRAPSYQYIESYVSPNSEQIPFREYYKLSSADPWQVVNAYGPDGNKGGGDDKGNPPLPPSGRLAGYRTCKGQTCP